MEVRNILLQTELFVLSADLEEEKFRDTQMEDAVLYQTLAWFGEYDNKTDVLAVWKKTKTKFIS